MPVSEPPQRPEPEPIPRLPRGSGFKLSRGGIFRILMFTTLLVGVLALRQPCSDGVARFVEQFDVDAAPATAADAGALPPSGNFVRITGDMSDEQLRQKLEQAGVLFGDAGAGDAGR